MSLKQQYTSTILPAVQKSLDIKNPSATPKLEKIVLNVGIGSTYTGGNKDFSSIKEDLGLIAGQLPVVRYASKSISNFKLREGMPVGLTVTLRGDKMFDFLEKLIHVVLPRVRDFQGLKPKAFDDKGNYNIGVKEHTIFPEIVQDDIVKPFGLQITLKTTANSMEEGQALMKEIGIPLKK